MLGQIRSAIRTAFGWKGPSELLAGNTKAGIDYWIDRAAAYGRRSVLDIRHTEGEIDGVVRKQVAEIFPHVQKLLNGSERQALDFGCGPGLFSALVAELIGGKCVAVDPVQSLLDLAPKHESVRYLLLGRDLRIPLQDGSVDLAWVCNVLGGVEASALPAVCGEIVRVLRPGGLLVLTEATPDRPGNAVWTFRSVAAYTRMFPGIGLRAEHEYTDIAIPYTVMAGRKPVA